MKILIIGTAYPYKGGIASFNERMALQFQNMGHEVHIETFTLQYPKYFFPGKSQFSDAEPPSDITIHRGINSVNPFTWWSRGRNLRKEKYDLIISKFWLPAMGPALGSTIRSARAENTKVISVIDNIIPHEKRLGDRKFTQYFVNSVDGYAVMSHKVEEQMSQFVVDKPIIYNPHPIYDNYGDIETRSDALAHLGLDPDLEYVLFFGYIRKYKGLDILIESFAKASQSNPKLRLIVAGEYYSDKEEYLNLISHHGLEENVILRTDFIPNDEVRYYFCAADLVAQTYRSATQSGISQIAIYFEKAILTTNVGGLPETTIDGKTGYVVPVDIDAIAKGMLDFFDRKNMTDFQGEIQKLKASFSWDSFCTRLINLREKL